MDSRARFEAYSLNSGRNVDRYNFTGEYVDVITGFYWEAWQACEASREFVVELPELHEPRYEYDNGVFMEESKHGQYLYADEVKAAIEKAGGRVK